MAQFIPWIFLWTASKPTTSTTLAKTSTPSIVRNVGNDRISIGSTVGPSALPKAAWEEEEVEANKVEQVLTTMKVCE